MVVVEGLNTKVLAVRVFTRDSEHPEAKSGTKMYFKMRVSGDPSWGDASVTFVKAQNQIWVTPFKQ
jgi:hypothetical protein